MGEMTIRPAIGGDAPAIAAVVARAYRPYVARIGKPPGPMLDDYDALVREGTVWVIGPAGAVFGVLVLIPKADHLLLDNIAVAPDHQGKGIGKRLLAFAEAEADRRDYTEIRLYTHQMMIENQRLYAAIGYQETGRGTESGYDRVFMCKRVVPSSRAAADQPSLGLTYFSPKVEKRPSRIHGRGLFARTRIGQNEIVVIKGGYILTKDRRDEIGKEIGPAEIQITEDLFIGPATLAEREGGMMHLNHSCEPNLGLQGQIIYVALRDIDADEELTFDYAMTDDEEYELPCRCGSPVCRRVITGKDWTRPEIQSRYDGYFSWFIQRRIDAAKRRPG